MKPWNRRYPLCLLAIIAVLAGWLPGFTVWAQGSTPVPVVQAVLFYRSTCSHCVQLVNEVLPSILNAYGDRLQIFYCDVSSLVGDALFTSAIDRFGITTIGVPTIVVGEAVLIGSRNIEQQFPGKIDAGLAQGGLGWPDIPGLPDAFSTAGSMTLPALGSGPGPSDLLPVPASTPVVSVTQAAPAIPAVTPSLTIPAPASPLKSSWVRNFQKDPQGNSLAVIVLAGMLLFFGLGIRALFQPLKVQPVRRVQILVPLLGLLGVGISAYLAYVEVTLAEAICGPVGECNAVQSSSYARLAGIPVGLLGLGGYLLILLAWTVAWFGRGRLAEWAKLVLLGLATGGLLFSIYLTFLEPFVIGASCLWCLGSAVIMTVLFRLSLAPAREILFHGGKYAPLSSREEVPSGPPGP